jgi:GTPase SAR1 family protein
LGRDTEAVKILERFVVNRPGIGSSEGETPAVSDILCLEAAVLVHVVDLSSRNAAEQCKAVEETLSDLELAGKPRITVLNKIDLLLAKDRDWNESEALAFVQGQCPPAQLPLIPES